MVNEIPTLLYFVRTWDVSVLPLLVAISEDDIVELITEGW
jgi:hypothetical protein